MQTDYKKRPTVKRSGMKKTKRGRIVRTGNTTRRSVWRERGRDKREQRAKRPIRKR